MSELNDKEIEELHVKEVWERLAANEKSMLIDVRTYAEWSYVGCVDLSSISKQPILLEWIKFVEQQVNDQFVGQLESELNKLSVSQEDELFFLCRSGVRSLAAAKAMAQSGYKRCFNVVNGFEGPLDADQHRGTSSGWKAEGLPWRQG